MSKFKISGVGIDLSKIDRPIPEYSLGGFGYIHTDLKIGNEYLIKKTISENHILVVTVDFLDGLESIVPKYLHELGKSCIDVLMIDSRCKIEDYVDTLNNLIISGFVSEVGISNPESVKRLNEIRNKVSQLNHVSLNICPLNFEWTIIKYCQDNNIKILGFNAFGGRFSYPRLIESFSVPYLLSFSAAYSDVVFLSGLERYTDYETSYLLCLMDKEYGKEFQMSQDVTKLPKDPKKAVYTSLKLPDGSKIPYSTAGIIWDWDETEFNLSTKPTLSEPAELEGDELTSMVRDYFEEFDGGPKDNPSPSNAMTALRYQILGLARIQYPEIDGWTIFCNPIDELSFTILGIRRVKKKRILWFSKEIIETVEYIASYDGTKLVFSNLKYAFQEE